jgi:hypothetical protein
MLVPFLFLKGKKKSASFAISSSLFLKERKEKQSKAKEIKKKETEPGHYKI